MNYQWASPFQREVKIKATAVPTSLTAQTTVDTDIERITLSNTTGSSGSSITFKLTNAAGTVLAGLDGDAFTISPGVPVSFEFHPPLRTIGGFKVQAGASGLVMDIDAWKRPNFAENVHSY